MTRHPQGRQFYGWHEPAKGFLVSREPPDAPVRPAYAFDSAPEAEAYIKKTKRGEVMWFPPLTSKLKKPMSHAG